MAPQNSVQDPMVGKMIFVSLIFKLPEMYSLSDLICLHSFVHLLTMQPDLCPGGLARIPCE